MCKGGEHVKKCLEEWRGEIFIIEFECKHYM